MKGESKNVETKKKKVPRRKRKEGRTMSRKKKLINNSDLPDHEIEAIARCIYPDILELFESEEGQKEFAEWKARKAQEEKENEQ